jgi:hypothetical protein
VLVIGLPPVVPRCQDRHQQVQHTEARPPHLPPLPGSPKSIDRSSCASSAMVAAFKVLQPSNGSSRAAPIFLHDHQCSPDGWSLCSCSRDFGFESPRPFCFFSDLIGGPHPSASDRSHLSFPALSASQSAAGPIRQTLQLALPGYKTFSSFLCFLKIAENVQTLQKIISFNL